MEAFVRILKLVVAAFVIWAGPALAAEEDRLDDLFDALASAEGEDAARIVDKIGSEWSKSGSPSMDLLLERGREALEEGRTEVAVGHLSALVDHAPGFAEGYHARATAYIHQKRFGQALDDLRIALELNPRHFGAMIGLALILDDIGREKDSLAAWREVQRYYPASPEAEIGARELEAVVEGRPL